MDEPWVLDVLGVPYGGPYGGRDSHGEYFTPETDLWLDRIPRRPVIYYHGLAEDGHPEVIGEELSWERRADGVWFRVLLDGSKALARRVWQAAQQGAARASSGAIGHLVRIAADGRILTWAMAELSLLDGREHTPANPYAVALAHAKATFAKANLAWIDDPQEEDDMDENTLRAIIRQEIALAAGHTHQEVHPMFLTGEAPAVISQRGEAPLTANGTPFVDAVKAMRQGRFETVRFQLSGKALSEGTDSAGGYLVPVEHSSQLIEMLRARTAVRAAGATVIPMNSDTLQIPAQVGGATAYWVAENSAITASDQTWDQVQLQAKKLAALTKLSAELFEDSDPGVEQLVMADLARVLALEEDASYLRGAGTGSTPEGLENITGVNVDTTTLGANGGTPSFDNLADMVYRLDADDVPGEGRAWIVHPRTVNTLRQIKGADQQYLWADPAQPGDPPTLWGYPVFTTTSVPINETQGTSDDCSTVYLGAWPEFLIGQRKALELRASDAAGTAFEYDQVFIRAIMRVDCNVRHPASFEVLKGVRA
ncbi:MAG: phage major capsid protein [Chloroflexi bacterium]|nr:phage major capsid protein [Chloroflexota bacterium]